MSPLPLNSLGPKKLEVALLMPMYRDISYETFNFVDLVRSLPPPEGWSHLSFIPNKSSPVHVTRENLVENLLLLEKKEDMKHDIVVWIDSDNGFDRPAAFWDLVLRMHSAPPKVAVLGVPCQKRGFPLGSPNFGCYLDGDQKLIDALYEVGPGATLPTNPARTTRHCPFALVRRIGFGIVAMRRTVFDELKKPWFDWQWAPTKDQSVVVADRGIGEDALFCDSIRKIGYLVVADFGLAREAWHLYDGKWKLPQEMTHEPASTFTWSHPS